MISSVGLQLDLEESIEARLKPIFVYLTGFERNEFWIEDVDATGQIGNRLTKEKNNSNASLLIGGDDLNTIVSELGQIFELNVRVIGMNNLRIILRDGTSIDIVGELETIPQSIFGKYIELDISLFNPG